MADPLSYNSWVSQKYTETDDLKNIYIQRKTAETIAAGKQPSASDVSGWRAEIPSSESDKWKKQLYAQYVVDFVKKQ